MVGLESNLSVHFLQTIQDWLVQYWVDHEPDPDYRIALASLQNTLWPKPGSGARPSYFPLPMLCGHALGNVTPATTAANAAWVLLFIASYLLDKIEDEEIHHPIFQRFSPAVVANLTTGLILHSGLILEGIVPGKTPPETLAEMRREFQRKALSVCAGQHQDLTVKEPSFDQIWQITDAKSGRFFALGAYIGARLATNDDDKVVLLSEVGRRLGIINQINNDLSGLGNGEETGSDLASGKCTLPVQFALQMLPPAKRAKLVEYLYNAPRDPLAEIKARQMIVSAGAIIYLTLETSKHRQQAILLLEQLNSSSDRLTSLYNLINYNVLRANQQP